MRLRTRNPIGLNAASRSVLLILFVCMRSAQGEPIPDNLLFDRCAAEFFPIPPSRWRASGDEPAATAIEADDATVDGDRDKTYIFTGSVNVFRADQALQGEHVIYRSVGENVEANDAVKLWQKDVLFTGDSARFSFSTETGYVRHSLFFLKERHARGSADDVDLISRSSAILNNTTYTTCDVNDESWHLHARTLTLNTADNVGTATHVWVDFKDIPFFYFPYINFPLTGRKTGFLFPTFGRSSRLGTQLAIPFYWNIAPDRDATFTLQNLSERGQQVLGEFRYLNANNNGQLNVEYLANDTVTDTSRRYLEYAHHWNPAPRWVSEVNYRDASDKDYFRDFGDRLSTTQIVHLERNAHVDYRGDIVSSQASIVDYQTLDATIAAPDRPYKKLPDVTVHATAPSDYHGIRWAADAEAVKFDGENRVTGARVIVYPSLSYPMSGIAGFFNTKAGVHQTWYSLENQAPDIDVHPSRTVPIISADSALFFEREVSLGRSRYLQTLEPRAFYLYVPYRDQDRLIADANGTARVFDAGANSVSYGQLFAENRFSGGDRIGDANQLTLALSSRIVDATGVERSSVSLGRILYFKDREVTLPGVVPDTVGRSNLVAEARAHPIPFLDISSSAQWDSTLDAFTQFAAQARYQSHKRRIINVGARFTRDANGDFSQRETDLSAFWPIAESWNIIARQNYSLLARRSKERLVGVEYDSCCWAFRIVSRSYISNTNDADWVQNPNVHSSILLQLELKGLSSVGQNIQNLLEHSEHGIAGY